MVNEALPDTFMGVHKDSPLTILDGSSKRDACVAVGAAFRELNPYFWVERMLRDTEEMAGFVIVDDVRFPEEFTMLRQQKAHMVKLVPTWRPGEILGAASEGKLENDVFDFEFPQAKYWPDRIQALYHYAAELGDYLASNFPTE